MESTKPISNEAENGNKSKPLLCDGFLNTTEVIELTSKIVTTSMKGLYKISALIKINGDKETETNFLCFDKKDLKRIKVGFKWTGEYWGSGS